MAKLIAALVLCDIVAHQLKAGQLLVRLDPADAQVALDQAEAEVANERMRGYIARVREDDVVREELVAIEQAIALQRETGVDVYSDGEYRRLSFLSDVADAVDGFVDAALDAMIKARERDPSIGDGADVPPEKRPSVISATFSPMPWPYRAAVVESISRIPGPPFGPS